MSYYINCQANDVWRFICVAVRVDIYKYFVVETSDNLDRKDEDDGAFIKSETCYI